MLIPTLLLGALLLAAGARRRALAPYAWLAVLALGRWITLSLTEAGRFVGYQHLADPLGSSAGLGVRWGLLALYGAVVLAGALRHRSDLAAKASALSLGQWVVVALLSVLLGATVSREVGVFLRELMTAAPILALQLLNLGLVLATATPQAVPQWVTGLLEPDEGAPRLWDRFALGWAAFVALLALGLGLGVYQAHPHVPDELGYLFHARYFARGLLYLPPLPVAESFNVDLMTFEPDRWYSPVPPGWPAVLSIGVRLGVPWLVNPVLAGLNILLAHLLVWRLTDRPTARFSTVLLALSPWPAFLAMSFMTHTWAFTCLLLAGVSVERLRTTGALHWGLWGGAAIGMISLIRPLEGLAVALLMGLWSLGARGRGFRFAPSAVLTVATATVAFLQLWYNRVLTGEARTFPLMQYFDRVYGPGVNDLGFGPDRGVGWALDPYPGHGLRDVVVNTNLNLTATNVELFGWGIGSLFFVWVLLARRRWTKLDGWMAAVLVMVIGVHALYYFSGGPDFGARYWYPILLPLVLLTARAVLDLRTALPRLPAAVLALSVISLGTFLPWRASDKYWHYRNMRPDVRTLAAALPLEGGLVFVRGDRHPDYASAAIYNSYDFSGPDPVYVWDRDPALVPGVLGAFPGRSVWILEGPTITGDGFLVAAGPLSEREARLCQAEGRWPRCEGAS